MEMERGGRVSLEKKGVKKKETHSINDKLDGMGFQ